MKILHIINSVNPADGGPIEGIRQLGGALTSAGHLVEVASLDAPDAPYLKHCSLPVYPLGPTTLKYGLSPRFIPWLRSHRSEYDAAIVNGIWRFHSFGAWCALRNSETPYVLFTHGMLDPWFKRHYPLKHLKKWLYWPWAEYRVLRDARAVLFTCEEERLLARSSFWLYRCNEMVVSYGTGRPSSDPELELQEFFNRYPKLRGKRLALFMGRLHPKKGCDLLIEAFARVLSQNPDWHLIIAGPDQVGWQKHLTYRAAELGMTPRVTWTGMVGGTTKWGALGAAEIFVLPSHQENFGIAVAEALAAGLPVLISNKVNIWREIERDGAGITADDTLEGTCKLLQSYIDLTPSQKLAMRGSARMCFEQRFEIKKAAETLHAVLASLTGVN
jgi:glycosyltransferase involved in cell wall biosynthesis